MLGAINALTCLMKRILVIDDQDDMTSMIAAILVVAGFAVRGATDGRDGILKVLAERPDLILCDIKMRGMDGYRTLEAIRKFPGTADIPLIMMTGSTVKAEFRRELDCSGVGFLSKPFTPGQLLAAVESGLARQPHSEPEMIREALQPCEGVSHLAFNESAEPSARFAVR